MKSVSRVFALFLVALLAILTPSSTFANDGITPPPADSIPVVNPDGSLNCGNPVNAATLQCTGGAPILPDCSLPMNAVLPACGGAPIPPPTDSMPVTFPDGSLNCANPVNASTIQCTGGAPILPDCSLPMNAVLPACAGAPVPPPAINQPMYNGDGSVNCANPANATMALCMNLFQSSANGQLDCSRPELQSMPICGNSGNVPPLLVNPDGTLNCSNPINATTIQCTGTNPTSQDCSLPQNVALPFCVLNQPMYNNDGSLNCAQPANATMALCMGLFAASETGTLNCTLRELQNMPICIQTGATSIAQPSSAPAPTAAVSSAANVAAVSIPAVPAANAQLPTRNEGAGATPNRTVVTEKAGKDKEESFGESDGEEEPPSGTLAVSFNSAQNRYVVRIDCNLAGEKLTIRAVKKGSKSLRFSVTIDEDGVGGVRTKTKLAGYTLTLYYGSEKLDQVRVK